jgi:hypothetical protein
VQGHVVPGLAGALVHAAVDGLAVIPGLARGNGREGVEVAAGHALKTIKTDNEADAACLMVEKLAARLLAAEAAKLF